MKVLLLIGWLFIKAFVFPAVCGQLALFYRDQSAIIRLKSGIEKALIRQSDEFWQDN
jgi:hypothetical protein